MATEENPAYGMSAPRGRAPPETKGDYAIPHFHSHPPLPLRRVFMRASVDITTDSSLFILF